MLYFFIAHIYDNILNPWHWTDDMRKASLTSGNFGLAPGLKVVDVGAGTGFTTIGVLEEKVTPGDVIMLDQSPQQLSKARVKPELKGLKAILEGDAENLPKEWTGEGCSQGSTARNHSYSRIAASGKFDRYVSAGSIEYWPHPQLAIDEAARVVNEGGKAMIIGPVRATNPLSRFFADMWYLFPEEREYEAWFKSAGFTNVTISRVTPRCQKCHMRSPAQFTACVLCCADIWPPQLVRRRPHPWPDHGVRGRRHQAGRMDTAGPQGDIEPNQVLSR